jgi:2-methylcitrate dehydratase PrpD
MAKSVLLDTLAVGVRGAESEAAAATRKGITSALECSSGSASLWGTQLSLPPSAAALVNGTAAHAYEFDDFGGCGHSGAVVVPAVCAMAERVHADGRSVLMALAAGYDVAARVTLGAGGIGRTTIWAGTLPGTCGTFGAAAGAARVMGLDANRFTSALGITGSFAGGVWAFLVDGAMTKRFHPGRAAENGREFGAARRVRARRAALHSGGGVGRFFRYLRGYCGDARRDGRGSRARIPHTAVRPETVPVLPRPAQLG